VAALLAGIRNITTTQENQGISFDTVRYWSSDKRFTGITAA